MCRFLFFEYLALSIFVYLGIFSICITPNMPVAYMVSGTVYFSKSPCRQRPAVRSLAVLSLLAPHCCTQRHDHVALQSQCSA
jgi:hypothetical protein